MRVGLTVRRWFRCASAQIAYEATLTDFVDWLIEERNAQVVFVPQVTHALAGDDDRVVAARIVGRLRQSDAALLLTAELRPGEVKGLCGEMKYFVGTRMHSNIFALSMGVPALAIGYLPKTEGLMEQLGLEAWTLPIETLDVRMLQDAYTRLVACERELRQWLAERVPEITRSALRSGRAIEDAFLRRDDVST